MLTISFFRILSHMGTRMTGFTAGLLVKPYGGATSHIGVKIGRGVYVPVPIAKRVQEAAASLRADGFDA